jgi:hypothetical protein
VTLALVSLLLAHAPLDLKWMSGSWRATDPKHALVTEELWLCSAAGLTGVYRETLEGKPGFYELGTILPEGDRLVLTMRMFDRALKDAAKTAKGPLRFVLDTLEFQRAVFKGEGANKASLTYELINPHRLRVTLDRADGAPTERFELDRFFL